MGGFTELFFTSLHEIITEDNIIMCLYLVTVNNRDVIINRPIYSTEPTHQGWMTLIYVSKLGYHWFR